MRGRQNHLIRADGLKCCDGTRIVRRVGAGRSNLNIGVKSCETRSSRGDEAQPWVSEWENRNGLIGGNGRGCCANLVRECCGVERNCFVGGGLHVAWIVLIACRSMLGSYG